MGVISREEALPKTLRYKRDKEGGVESQLSIIRCKNASISFRIMLVVFTVGFPLPSLYRSLKTWPVGK